MSGDSQFHFIIKNFDIPHSMGVIQKLFECLFIKRFVSKAVNCLEYAIKYTKPKSNNIYRTFLLFSNGLDEDYLLLDKWKKYFNNINMDFTINSYGFFFINSNNLIKNHKEEFLKMKNIWDNFKSFMKKENIIFKLYYYSDNFEGKELDNIYNKISKNYQIIKKASEWKNK